MGNKAPMSKTKLLFKLANYAPYNIYPLSHKP
jgi:hypothetical protein